MVRVQLCQLTGSSNALACGLQVRREAAFPEQNLPHLAAAGLSGWPPGAPWHVGCAPPAVTARTYISTTAPFTRLKDSADGSSQRERAGQRGGTTLLGNTTLRAACVSEMLNWRVDGGSACPPLTPTSHHTAKSSCTPAPLSSTALVSLSATAVQYRARPGVATPLVVAVAAAPAV